MAFSMLLLLVVGGFVSVLIVGVIILALTMRK